MSDNPFDPDKTKTAIGAELDRLDQLPTNTIQAGVVAQNGDVGAAVTSSVDPGKPGGAFAAVDAVWWKRAGYKVAAMVGWRPKG